MRNEGSVAVDLVSTLRLAARSAGVLETCVALDIAYSISYLWVMCVVAPEEPPKRRLSTHVRHVVELR